MITNSKGKKNMITKTLIRRRRILRTSARTQNIKQRNNENHKKISNKKKHNKIEKQS